MATASAEKKIIVSKVFRAGSGLSRTPLSPARCEALPLKFSDGGMLREEAAPAPKIPRFCVRAGRAAAIDVFSGLFFLFFLKFSP
jgi:hypothetical protein